MIVECLMKSWRCVSASVVGSGHIAQRLPCQDAHAALILGNGNLILGVADGAGSAERSAEGSRRAIETSADYLATHLLKAQPEAAEECEQLLEKALIHARGSLEEIAHGNHFQEVATTLLLAVVTDCWLSTVQVGDGAVVCRDISGSFKVLSKLGDSEYLNETTFLTSSDYLNRLNHTSLPIQQINGIAVLTDGMQLLALRYADNTAHEPFFRAMFEFAENPDSTQTELEEFLRSERVCDRTDDDKTIVLAVPL